MAYVDGFVLAVPKDNLWAYKELAALAGKVWMEHGALAYVECVGDDVWANVWRTDRIVRIRIADGTVTGVAEVPDLRPASTKGDADAVLNGIAHAGGTGTFLLTGKRWPVIHEVRFTRTGG